MVFARPPRVRRASAARPLTCNDLVANMMVAQAARTEATEICAMPPRMKRRPAAAHGGGGGGGEASGGGLDTAAKSRSGRYTGPRVGRKDGRTFFADLEAD